MVERTFFRDMWAELDDGSRVYPYTGVLGAKQGLYSINFTSDNSKFEGVTEERLRELAETGQFRERGMIRMLPLDAKPGAQMNAFAPTHYNDNLIRAAAGLSGSRTPSRLTGHRLFPDVVEDAGALLEGATTTVRVNAFERSDAARRACLAHHGCKCKVCSLDFEERYGELGRGFIHVHHLQPLASIRSEYEVDPIQDLVPVCPNCHAMIHRTDPPVSIEDLRRRLGLT